MAETFDPLGESFSTADKGAPILAYEQGTLHVRFRDWRERGSFSGSAMLQRSPGTTVTRRGPMGIATTASKSWPGRNGFAGTSTWARSRLQGAIGITSSASTPWVSSKSLHLGSTSRTNPSRKLLFTPPGPGRQFPSVEKDTQCSAVCALSQGNSRLS
jgi:hypothetical protein